jgi:CheY-like chemotaxis protein
MARVLVVSRNPAMAMGLSATDYEVVDLRPPAFGAWIDTGEDADALILDLENPKLAVAAVTNLRAHGKLAPVLLVSSDRPGWDDPQMRQLPAAAVLPLPISRPALLSALEDLLSDPWATAVIPAQHAEVTQALQELVIGPGDLMSPDDDLDTRISAPPASEPIPDYQPPERYQPLDDVPEWSTRGTVVAGVVAAEPGAEAAEGNLGETTESIDVMTPAVTETADGPTAVEDPEPAVSKTAARRRRKPRTTSSATVAAAGARPEKAEPSDQDDPARVIGAEPEIAEVEVPAEPVEEPLEEAVVETAAVPTADPRDPYHPPLSAVPRTRRTSHLPSSATSTSLREMEALRPGATPVRRREAVQAPRGPAPAAIATPPAASATGQKQQEPAASIAGHAVRGEDAVDLVRRLSGQLHRLYGVPEVSEVIVTDAVDRTKADAGAILVPDAGDWRVAAGVGLRPLETRYELHDSSWVVQQVAKAHKGVIIQESDVAREQLQGAPLASWRHLLAAPVPDVEAVLLLARREDPPFDEGDLAVLATLGTEAGPLLSAALETRSLARHLYDFRDEGRPPTLT